VFLTLGGVGGCFVCFSPGGYLETIGGTGDPKALPWVVDSFTMSVSVCLHALYLIDRWRADPTASRGARGEIERLEGLRRQLTQRLTDAMLGLCRSFAVSVQERKGEEGWEERTQRSWPQDASGRVLRDIGRRLGMFADPAALRGKAFECGWSWGPTPPDPFEAEYQDVDSWPAQEFYAEPAPYLYFTIGAIDGIGDLFSQKIVAAHLLTPQQSALATRLGFYRECASSYWSALAFAETPSGAWAVEDLPWRTADGSASDYWTLYLLTIALASDQARENFGGEQKLSRLLSLLEELAQRGRITRRPHPPGADPAVALHVPPGEQLCLRTMMPDGQPGAMVYSWSIYDFAPRLLKLVAQVLAIATERSVRERASRLIDDIWSEHLVHRRVAPEVDSHAWDDIRTVFGEHPVSTASDEKTAAARSTVGSWYITERVVEALVAVVNAQRQRRSGGRLTAELANEILDDLGWIVTTGFPDETEIVRRVAAALEMVEESPTLALGIALEIGQDIAQKRTYRQQARDQEATGHDDA